MITIKLTRAEAALLQACLHDLSWQYGYAIGPLSSNIQEQIDGVEY